MFDCIFFRSTSPDSIAQDWFNTMRKINEDPAEYDYKSDAEIQSIAEKVIRPLKNIVGDNKLLCAEEVKKQILPLKYKDSRFPHAMIRQITPFLRTDERTFQPIFNDLRSVCAGIDPKDL